MFILMLILLTIQIYCVYRIWTSDYVTWHAWTSIIIGPILVVLSLIV